MLSIVVPCHNEAAVLPQVYTRLSAAATAWEEEHEVLLIDDGSTDGTWHKIAAYARRDPRWKGVRLARNFGHQAALGAGLQLAEGDAVVCLDADLQDPPELIVEFLERWRAGAEVVYGVRAERPEGLLKRCCYSLFYWLMVRSANIPLPRDAGDFALLDHKVVRALRAFREQRPFWRGLRAYVGFRQEGVPYARHSRQAGEPQYTLAKLLQLAGDGFWSLTTLPLDVLTLVASCALVFVLCGGGVLVAADRLPLTTWLVAVLCGLNLAGIALVGRYLAKLLDEARRRPRWIVAERVGFTPRPSRRRLAAAAYRR